MRLLVLYETGRAGTAALELARQEALHSPDTVTVVSVAPAAPSWSRCGNSALEFNEIVRETVAKELEQAREQLATLGERASFQLLIEGSDPPLSEWVAAGGFDIVLLPARRRPLRAAKHPAAAALSGAGAVVRVVERS